MDAPSMVQRSGDTLIVRSVVSGNQLFLDGQEHGDEEFDVSEINEKLIPQTIRTTNIVNINETIDCEEHTDQIRSDQSSPALPQCKIKRNYSCNSCSYFTQNPRHFLTHLKDIHGEKIIINACKQCLYASRHYQKLVRHMKMVHGSTDGLEEQAQSRKRATQLAREQRKRKNNFEQLQVQQNHQQQQQQQLNQLKQLQQQKTLQEQTLQQQLVNTVLPLIQSANFLQQQQQQQQQQHSQQQQQQQQQSCSNLSETPSPDNEYSTGKLEKCTICDFTTFNRTQLIEHERDEHDRTKFFRCGKCSYVTHIKARFSKHVKYHSMPMIKCVMCDFRTPYKWNLDRHMKNHGGAGVYKCSACNFTADIKQSLTVHEMNHHVPPVGHASGMSMARRKNKVGGTDIVEDYLPMNLSDTSNRSPFEYASANNSLIVHNNNNNNSMDSFNEPPTMKKIKLEFPADLSRKPHTQTSSTNSTVKKQTRPVPNLIPIQQTQSIPISSKSSTSSRSGDTPQPTTVVPASTNQSSSAMNLTMPSRHFLDTIAAVMSQKGMNESCGKSQKSALKNLASLFISEEVFAGQMAAVAGQFWQQTVSPPQLSPTSSASSNTSTRRKNGSNFFEELQEKLMRAGNQTDGKLPPCGHCGHVSKCLSELLIHQKHCNWAEQQQDDNGTPVNLTTGSAIGNSGVGTAGGGSIRCQYCRHRCKSSSDLYAHQQQCIEARSVSNGDSMESMSDYGSNEKIDVSEDVIDEMETNEPHPMENRVFVWNRMPNSSSTASSQPSDDSRKQQQERSGDDSETTEDVSYYGVETAPGYGEVTKKLNPNDDESVSSSLKKVFKCPHCSFWASTASRFHVHIVGHLNKKPFECSLCSYRSNWRWDITKHIRLKTIRDPSHKSARVLMNDETGRRNYTKYNKHITLMRVTEEDGDPKLLKSGEMTPSQEAALTFSGRPSSANETTDNGKSLNEGYLIDRDVPLSLVKENWEDSSNKSTVASPAPTEKSETDGKRTSFKCKKCNFRHPNRDVVLTHVKGHYYEAGMLPDPSKSSPNVQVPTFQPSPSKISPTQLLSPKSSTPPLTTTHLLPPPLLELFTRDLTSPLSTSTPITGTSPTALIIPSSIICQQLQQTQLLAPPISGSVVTVNNNNTNITSEKPIMLTSTIENGEMNEASSLGTSVTGWRDPAPYRCGHCHQVSNWKHVIQRHCRLKHNGDINIELIEKGNNKKRNYNRLILPGGTTTATTTTEQPTTSVVNTEPIISTDITTILNNPQQITTTTGNSSSADAKDNEDDKIEELVHPKHLNQQQIQLIQLLNRKPAISFRCELCSFVSLSQTQLEAHSVSMHHNGDNGQFHCSQCNFTSIKQHLLQQHVNTQHPLSNNEHDANSVQPTAAIDLTIDQQDDQQLMFCRYCPARFFEECELNVHCNMHASFYTHRCTVCTYTARQEASIEAHTIVHSDIYQDKTKLLLNDFVEHKNYPQPKLMTIQNRENSTLVWIVAEFQQKTAMTTNPTTTQNKELLDLDDVISASRVPNTSFNNNSITKLPVNSEQLEKTKPTTSSSHTTIEKQIRKLQEMKNAEVNDTNQVNDDQQTPVPVTGPIIVRLEKCPHCPFSTMQPNVLKDHMQCHICVSGIENLINCDHCDYSVANEVALKEHVILHFGGAGGGVIDEHHAVNQTTYLSKRKNVAFFTSYENLIINRKCMRRSSGNCNCNTENSSGTAMGGCKGGNCDGIKQIYPMFDSHIEGSSDEKENKIIVDIATGEVIK